MALTTKAGKKKINGTSSFLIAVSCYLDSFAWKTAVLENGNLTFQAGLNVYRNKVDFIVSVDPYV